ncbi:ATP-binding cassette domain-containing protein [candidate division KSB1 bacterium]|nr:ATP-binding cassette domain-containing protein [candidate division KSB1 bacterium]
MIATTNLSILYGQQVLFKDVSIKFVEENCYGLIGANGSGKSTFLQALSGEIDVTSGFIHLPKCLKGAPGDFKKKIGRKNDN